jgi:hypothetical protein
LFYRDSKEVSFGSSWLDLFMSIEIQCIEVTNKYIQSMENQCTEVANKQIKNGTYLPKARRNTSF